MYYFYGVFEASKFWWDINLSGFVKNLHLCFGNEQKFSGIGMTLKQVNGERILHFGGTIT